MKRAERPEENEEWGVYATLGVSQLAGVVPRRRQASSPLKQGVCRAPDCSNHSPVLPPSCSVCLTRSYYR